ncbi:MAG: NAD(P)/FAD-dependent oxidoreductase [Candidatus Helarchaeota archaeon]
MTKYVIIGNGIAGVNAANTIRSEDTKGNIEIYTDEDYLTYARPKLPGYIAGIIKFQDLFIRDEHYYNKEKNIQLHLSNKVIDIHIDEQNIELENGQKVKFDKLLLANGSHSFVPPIKGSDKKNIMTIRSLNDSNQLISLIKNIDNVVVIGGGLLGIEIANSINRKIENVSIIEFFSRLLPRQLDIEGASLLQKVLEQKGINIFLNSSVEEILGNEKVNGVRLKSNEEIPAQCVIISTGVRPNINLAQKCNINCNRGIIVNEYMETNFPNIYACGDIAEFNGRVWGIIPVAFAQSKVAAINMVNDRKIKYEEIVPSNTLKITDIDLTSIGKIYFEKIPNNIIEKRMSDPKNKIYKKIVIENQDDKSILIGAILLGDKTNSMEIQTLIKQKINVSNIIDEILFPNTDLKKYL